MLTASAHVIEHFDNHRAIVMNATFGSFMIGLDEADQLITALAIARVRALDPTPLPPAPPTPSCPRRPTASTLEDLA